MEKKDPQGATGLKRSGRGTKKVPGGVRWLEAGSEQPSTSDLDVSEPSQPSKEAEARKPDSSRPSGEVAVLGSGPSRPSGEVAVLGSGPSRPSGEVAVLGSGPSRPSGEVAVLGSGSSRPSVEVAVLGSGSSRPSGEVAVLGSGPSQPPGEVAGRSLQSGTYPAVINTPCPGTGLSRASTSCSGRPKGKKSQRWDEMNILSTYHPPGKDYGFMKVDEPRTPYHRLQDSLEDLPAGSHMVTPEALAERFATMDNFYPKVLQYGDNRYSESPDNFTKTYSSDFDHHRKAHYDEAKFLKSQKTLPLGNNQSCTGGGVIVSSGGRGVMPDLEPRPVERASKRGSARGVKDETGLVANRGILEAKDSHTGRNQPPATATTKSEKEMGHQRKEYYSKGRYLRSSSQPELEDDIDEELKDSSSISLPMSTEVRRLDFTESPFQGHKAESTLMVAVTPGTPLPSGPQVVSGWCQWLVTRGLSWQSSEGPQRKSENNPNPCHQSNYRRETLQLQWNQEEETRQWKM
ncbi:uncharacterized protein [Dasypus novemcinctus]|uniref:uncharacterized protein isoform X2 n=1 Tax=Dasypus novemcinctus TaxID=9361 RepID=UPI00265E8EC5|nr:uncharacterized protein LOC131274992 isoform X2 [Dasypus novemcinctus]